MSKIPVQIQVKNSFGHKASAIALKHQFGSKTAEFSVWTDVASGAITSATTVNGDTDSGHDYWWITIVLDTGDVYYYNDKTCTIESSDKDTIQTQVVKKDSWTIPLESGGCSTSLKELND